MLICYYKNLHTFTKSKPTGEPIIFNGSVYIKISIISSKFNISFLKKNINNTFSRKVKCSLV